MATLLAKKFQQKLDVFNFSILDTPGGFYVLCSRFTLSSLCEMRHHQRDRGSSAIFIHDNQKVYFDWMAEIGWMNLDISRSMRCES